MYVDESDYAGVRRVAKNLQADIAQVTGAEPDLRTGDAAPAPTVVLIGTLGKSRLIDGLVEARKFDAAGLAGRWETFVIATVELPLPGVERALVIAGSDKRGTIFGMYELSAQIGVSPWNWWADVPAPRQESLYVSPGRHTLGEPAVKYRGIFINDEAPALADWAQEKFGGCNSKFYAKVFDLILRLRGNYLWPAMWGRSIYDDDPESPRLADELGVVIGTSHHEPMMRAHVEWERYGKGPWNYEKNEAKLREFWTEGVRRMGANESVVTVGMRGDGDEPMTEGANIALLERIIADQRGILGEVTGRDPADVPQMWALYKEVQEYYDKGMRVPDDVTLLLCDDNWGNVRKVPKLEDGRRRGGYGMYYHFDYVGDPRNYKWVNTNPIPRVWEQMHLAYVHGVDRLWIVNVGDIKPMEYPTEFFLDYAWNPSAWPAERLPEYARRWAAEQFGEKHAGDIAAVLTKYSMFNSRRKPELLAPDTFSLVNFREAERVVDEYRKLAKQAARIGESLPAEYRDAYFQLVLHPVEACANLNELYVTAEKNRLYAQQGRAATNDLAAKVRDLFAKDAELSRYYNETLAGGKWSHMMDQTHIGYDNWQQPDQDNMPKVEELTLPAEAKLGVAIEGSESWWPNDSDDATLPPLDPYQHRRRYFEVFNRGQAPFDFTAKAGEPWVEVSSTQGSIEKESRLGVTVDWAKAPPGVTRVPITIEGPGDPIVVTAVVDNPQTTDGQPPTGFVEADGHVSIEAEHYARAIDKPPVRWVRIPDMGRTLSAVTAMPVTAAAQQPGKDGPHLEYPIHLFHDGELEIRAYLSPTLNFHNTEGLHYAVSIDDEAPQVVNMHADKAHEAWQRAVSDNVNVSISKHRVDKPGAHTLKFWMVDPGVVLQKLVVATHELPSSYLGPPESKYCTPVADGANQINATPAGATPARLSRTE